MMTFFANGRFRSWKGWEHGRRWWTPIGWPGDSSQVVLNENTTNSFMAKLAYRLSTHFNLKYQLMFDNGDGTDVNRSFTYTPDAKNHWKSERWTHMFSVNHVLSPKTFYELRGARYYGENESYMLGSPLDSCTYLVHVEADTSRDLPEETFDPVLEPARLDSAKALRRLYYFITNPTSQLGYVHQDSSGVPTAYSFNRAGYPYMGNNKGHEGYWLGKFDLTSQITKVHQIKAGLEFKISELFQDNFSIIPRNRIGTSGNLEQEVPFKPEIPGDSTVNRNIYTRKPREYSAYLQDKIELKDLIVNIGVRYDYFDPNTVVPLDPKDPNIYFPMLPEHRYENYIPPDPSLSAPEREAWMRQFSLLTPDQRRALMQTATEPVFAVSPRLGLSYPITDQGIIHFCYGHFFAMPNMSLLYQSPDFKFNQGGGLSAFGNPALKPERTVQYEIGLQQQLSQNIGFDVTLFYKDIRDWAGAGPRIETYLPSITYSMMENKDYANIRGITFSLTKRHSNHFSANVDYTFQYAEGTYTDPFDAFNALANNQERRLSLIPLGYDQRHTLNTDVNFSYGTWSVTLLGQYHTGNPYTPASARGQSLGVGIRENSEYTPTVKNVDLYVNKFFDLGGLRLSLFAKVYNLFDIRNAYGVFADTGSPDYTTTVDATKQPYNALRVGTVEESIRNPYFVSGPRRVQVGMSVGF
jgi:outer membrane receptor protein involved in Fe transport